MTISEPFLPDDYSLTLINSLSASCAFTALNLALEKYPQAEATKIKEQVIINWRTVWNQRFQEDMALYTKLLGEGKVDGAIDELAQPEEFQELFNRTIKEVEASARVALWPEKT